MEHWKNQTLENLVEEYEGIVYRERWKWVVGYEGLYKISSFGRVKSAKRLTAHYAGGFLQKQNKILKQGLDKDGYPQVLLCKNGIAVSKKAHKLVGLHFILNPNNKPTINHRFGIKTDNRAHQLEWYTISEQTSHSYRVLGRKLSPNTYKPGKDNAKSKNVNQYDMEDNFIKSFFGTREAARLTGGSRQGIGAACRGRYLTSGGFKWKYDENI